MSFSHRFFHMDAEVLPDSYVPVETPPKALVEQPEQDIVLSIKSHVGKSASHPNLLAKRELGLYPTSPGRVLPRLAHTFLPSERGFHIAKRFKSPGFNGKYSRQGSMFAATTRERVYIYDTRSPEWATIKSFTEDSIRWAIVDVDWAPDDSAIIYSAWSTYVFYYNVQTKVHHQIPVNSDRSCAFSIRFSPRGNEFVCGTTHNRILLYNFESQKIVSAFGTGTKRKDINSVEFSDETGNVVYTAGDDKLIKVWDRRIIMTDGEPVGYFQGHLEGVTYLCSKGDGRHLISNSKDQSIKLWDVRRVCSRSQLACVKPNPTKGWDYRHRIIPRTGNLGKVFSGALRLDGDSSISTYRGHQVCETLIRCAFSPLSTTGQAYILSGSADGNVYVFDVLSGAVARKLRHHATAVRDVSVRDVSWHPNLPEVASTGFDGVVGRWSHTAESAQDDDDDDSSGGCEYP
eukprot:CAMPEP_0177641144 /NCGR_PEP_ID=MMETSP0447-20121125/6914_1 /TAXON_ID=0 /ORGANISM="Stygamoeba regulata, Strain BSH-02190019" /LENGTH=458 /DNA_ID=CAMNT_0019143251 /DNA_START=575 /DNA_END=1948 /DNA_ORIENTATION=-